MQPLVPSDQNLKEFTLRALIIGLILAVVLGAANAYLGLRAGMTIAATYPAAVIGMALIKLFKGTILEENMARTVGSIGESVAAGAIFTIPGFVLSGIWVDFSKPSHYVASSLIMIAGGILGIMFVALLRRVMVEDAELPYPESLAAAEIHKAGQGGEGGMGFLFSAMGIGAAVQTLCQLKVLTAAWAKFVAFKEVSFAQISLKAKAVGGIVLSSPGISPAYMGVGYIIGPKLASLNFAGGMIAWGLLVPMVMYFLAPSVMPADATNAQWIDFATLVWKHIVRPIAIGGMLVGASFTLFKMRNSLITGLKRSVHDVKAAAAGTHTVDRVNKDIPFTWLMLGLVFVALATFSIAKVIFGCSFLVASVAGIMTIILGFFFAAVSGYLVGIIGSSNNPMSGLTLTALVVTALVMVVLGVKGREGVAAVLGVAAIICVSTAVAGEMLQDLKAGHILGGTPWKMQVGDIIGVILSAAVMFGPLAILHVGDINDAAGKKMATLVAAQQTTVTVTNPAARPELQGKTLTLDEVKALSPDAQKEVLELNAGFGGPNLAAPQAGLMAMLSKGIVEGRMAWPLIIVGMLMGFGFILMQVKSPMLVSVGMYLNLDTTFAIFLGGLVKGIVEMRAEKKGLNDGQKIRIENVGVLLASGLIAGEALIGLLFGGLKFLKVNYELNVNLPFLLSLAVLAGIGYMLVRIPMNHAGRADEPAPPHAGH